MKYLATNVRMHEGTNSRGKYHWMTMQLFNDANPKANPTRLPGHVILQETTVNAFLEYKDTAFTMNEQGYYDVDMSKIPDEGLTSHHLDDLNPEIVALDGYYLEIYKRDTTDSKNIIHTKGSVRVDRNGNPLPPINSMRVFVQYYEAETFVDGQKVKRWLPVDTKEDIARQLLASGGYRKQADPTMADPTMADELEPEPTPEDLEAKRKALQEQLDALK